MKRPRRIRPHVHRVELTAALDRIAERHARADDETFARIDADSPVHVLEYLVKSPPSLPKDVVKADVCDGLVLNGWAWWEDIRREHTLLSRGVSAGISLGELGARLGVTDEGAQNRIDRLDALLRFDLPDASLAREARRVDRADADQAETVDAWFVEHEEEVATVAVRLIAWGDLGDAETWEWLSEVRSDWLDRKFNAATLTLMGLTAAALRVSPDVLGTLPQHPVHRAIRQVDELRTAFARLA